MKNQIQRQMEGPKLPQKWRNFAAKMAVLTDEWWGDGAAPSTVALRMCFMDLKFK